MVLVNKLQVSAGPHVATYNTAFEITKPTRRLGARLPLKPCRMPTTRLYQCVLAMFIYFYLSRTRIPGVMQTTWRLWRNDRVRLTDHTDEICTFPDERSRIRAVIRETLKHDQGIYITVDLNCKSWLSEVSWAYD